MPDSKQIYTAALCVQCSGAVVLVTVGDSDNVFLHLIFDGLEEVTYFPFGFPLANHDISHAYFYKFH